MRLCTSSADGGGGGGGQGFEDSESGVGGGDCTVSDGPLVDVEVALPSEELEGIGVCTG